MWLSPCAYPLSVWQSFSELALCLETILLVTIDANGILQSALKHPLLYVTHQTFLVYRTKEAIKAPFSWFYCLMCAVSLTQFFSIGFLNLAVYLVLGLLGLSFIRQVWQLPVSNSVLSIQYQQLVLGTGTHTSMTLLKFFSAFSWWDLSVHSGRDMINGFVPFKSNEFFFKTWIPPRDRNLSIIHKSWNNGQMPIWINRYVFLQSVYT